MDQKEAFAAALRQARAERGLTQEDFGIVSSRTYLSSLERGLKSPTLLKVDEIAGRLDIHPLSLLARAYLLQDPDLNAEKLIEQVKAELRELAPLKGPQRIR